MPAGIRKKKRMQESRRIKGEHSRRIQIMCIFVLSKRGLIEGELRNIRRRRIILTIHS